MNTEVWVKVTVKCKGNGRAGKGKGDPCGTFESLEAGRIFGAPIGAAVMLEFRKDGVLFPCHVVANVVEYSDKPGRFYCNGGKSKKRGRPEAIGAKLRLYDKEASLELEVRLVSVISE